MKTIKINAIQERFLKNAINLKECLFNFDISDKDFKEGYGFSKKQMEEAIKNIQNQLNNRIGIE